MKKNTTTYLIIGAIVIGGYFAYKNGMFGKKTSATPDDTADDTADDTTPDDTKPVNINLPSTPATTTTATGSGGSTPLEKATAIIDIATSGKPLSDAIDKAKGLLEDYKAGKVIIKTKKGQKNVKVTKKNKERQAVRIAKRTERKAKRKAKRGVVTV